MTKVRTLEIPEGHGPRHEPARGEVLAWHLEPNDIASTATPGGPVGLLAELHGALLPKFARVLNVGCGDGLIERPIAERRPNATISAVDLIVRAETHIPVAQFDSPRIPPDDGAFDVVMSVDVRHHTRHPKVLLSEARWAAVRAIAPKDHTRDGFFAGPTLRFMGWTGNAPHGTPRPYNYWLERRWHEAITGLGLTPKIWLNKLGLYAAPATWLFDRSLHFIARLEST